MSCKAHKTRNGRGIYYRLNHLGVQWEESTPWAYNDNNFANAIGKAIEISENMRDGTFNYGKRFPEGNRIAYFCPKPVVCGSPKSH
jgi:hypothetical protein